MLIDKIWKINKIWEIDKPERVRLPNGHATIRGNVRFDPGGKIYEYTYDLTDSLIYIYATADHPGDDTEEIYYVWWHGRGSRFILYPLDHSFIVKSHMIETFEEQAKITSHAN